MFGTYDSGGNVTRAVRVPANGKVSPVSVFVWRPEIDQSGAKIDEYGID